MATKPYAVRGKTTRKGEIKKAVKSLIKGAKPKISMRTKARRLQNMMEEKNAAKKTPRKKITDMFKTAPMGAGASGTAMLGQALKLAQKNKPSDRINVDDLKRAKQIIMKRRGK